MRSAVGRRSVSFSGALLLCALSGAMLALCFPRAGVWFLAWVALVPWLVAVRMASGWGAALGSWVGGFVFFGMLAYWLHLFGWSVWVVGALALGLWLMLWGVLVRWTGRLGPGPRLVGAAVLWCGVEWARGLGQFGFTWGWLGYSQSPALGLLPVARVAGTLGLSFLIALVNSALAEAVVGKLRGESLAWPVARAVAACGLAALCPVGAKAMMARQGGPGGQAVRVAVIQGSASAPGGLRAEQVNVPLTREEQERTLEIYGSLTRQAAKGAPALVVWPESALPGIPEEEPWIAERVTEAAREPRAWLLTGGPYRDASARPYNAAYLYAPSGNLVARYDKVKLVPFGEYLPWPSWRPFLERYHVREVDFAAGPVHRVLQAGTIALGPMICFESIFPEISCGLVARGAQVLVVITNDAWFGRTAAAAQHRQIAVLRAMETNRWVVRGASAGISSIIAPDGRVVAEAGLFERKVISAEIRLASGEEAVPWMARAFPWLMFYLSVASIIAPAARRKGRRENRAARLRSGPRRRGRAGPR